MDFLKAQIKKRKKFIKFILSGGIATLINLGLIYFFTDIFGIWYLFSSVLSFIISFFISFYLQKIWTFGNKNKDKNTLYKQLIFYLLLALLNLVINTLLMYALVDLMGFWYMLAQFFVTGLIATWNFFLYKKVIFRN